NFSPSERGCDLEESTNEFSKLQCYAHNLESLLKAWSQYKDGVRCEHGYGLYTSGSNGGWLGNLIFSVFCRSPSATVGGTDWYYLFSASYSCGFTSACTPL
ncbi:hypothetical protein LTR75_018080, partial [Friedmanniomyces endolithicus]